MSVFDRKGRYRSGTRKMLFRRKGELPEERGGECSLTIKKENIATERVEGEEVGYVRGEKRGE